MPRDGSGNFSLVSGNPVVTNTIISSSGWANPTLSDIASAITQSLSRDGQTTPTANLTMGNFRLTNLGNGTARTDAVNAGQIQDNQLVVLSSVGGTGDAITASTAPAITVYTTDAKWVYTPTASNTLTNPTININGLGAKTITQSNGVGLWSGALVVGTPYELLYDGTNFRVQSGTFGSTNGIASFVPPGTPFALRNKIIDGNFGLWNLGTSFNISGINSSYTADMWLAQANTGASATVSQGAWGAAGDPVALESPANFYMQFQVTSSSINQPTLAHRIESSATFQSRSATFSCWLWVASGTLTISNVQLGQIFGTGGSGTVVTNVPVTWNLTTTPQRFSVRIDVPSIAGKTVAGGNDCISIGIQMPASTLFTLRTTQWQLEDCPAGAPTTGLPTQFELRGLALEQQMAYRYVEKIGGVAQFDIITQMAATASAQNLGVMIPFKNKKRAIPAVSLVGTWSLLNCGTLQATATGVDNCLNNCVSSASGPVGFNTVNATTYIVADARL